MLCLLYPRVASQCQPTSAALSSHADTATVGAEHVVHQPQFLWFKCYATERLKWIMLNRAGGLEHALLTSQLGCFSYQTDFRFFSFRLRVETCWNRSSATLFQRVFSSTEPSTCGFTSCGGSSPLPRFLIFGAAVCCSLAGGVLSTGDTLYSGNGRNHATNS